MRSSIVVVLLAGCYGASGTALCGERRDPDGLACTDRPATDLQAVFPIVQVAVAGGELLRITHRGPATGISLDGEAEEWEVVYRSSEGVAALRVDADANLDSIPFDGELSCEPERGLRIIDTVDAVRGTVERLEREMPLVVDETTRIRVVMNHECLPWAGAPSGRLRHVRLDHRGQVWFALLDEGAAITEWRGPCDASVRFDECR